MAEPPDTPQETPASGYVGLATFCGLILTGIGGLAMGFAAVLFKEDWTAAGLFWIAAALSFGMLVNAFLRR